MFVKTKTVTELEPLGNCRESLLAHPSIVALFVCYCGAFRQVELDSGLIMLAQLRGATTFKLTPHNPCNSSCPELLGDLHEGEMRM